MTEPIGDYCRCSHLREAHDLGVRDGVKTRTRCSHAACGCREHRPEKVHDSDGLWGYTSMRCAADMDGCDDRACVCRCHDEVTS